MIATLTTRYQELQEGFPLRPVRTPQDRDAAQRALELLAVRGENSLSVDERDYLDVLSSLIEAYDREYHPMPSHRGTPHQRLVALVEHSHTTPAKLQKVLGLSQPQVTLILSGKRSISKPSAVKLAKHFKLTADFFL